MLYILPVALALITQAKPEPTPLDLVSAFETVLADAVAKAEPSVVAIAREKAGKGDETMAVKGRNSSPPMPEVLGGFELPQPDYMSLDYGSGVVIGDRGQILTAYHVVKGATRLNVRALGAQQFDAEIIAADPRSDLAVIVPREIPGQAAPKLTPVALGDATKLRKGMFLLALGNPYNAARDGRASASWGILANFARRLDPPPVSDALQLRHYPTLLQLDSKLNLGMSGGAVVNLRGELVGLTTNASSASGFDAQAGYAVPIDTLGRRVIDRLREGKEVEYGFLGIGLVGRDQMRISTSNQVGSVKPGTPASEGGLVVDDRIISVGGLPVIDAESLIAAVNAFSPGDPIKLKIVRGEQPLDKTIVLSKFPLKGEVIATNRPAPWRGLRLDYLSMLPDVNHGPELLDAMSRGGVGVIEVIPGSAADVAGLRAGQVILAVGDTPVKTPTEFARAVADLKGPVEFVTESDRRVTVK